MNTLSSTAAIAKLCPPLPVFTVKLESLIPVLMLLQYLVKAHLLPVIKPLFVELVWLINICFFDHLYFLSVPLQREGCENPVLLLKEDSTIWKNTLLGALECKLNSTLFVVHLCLHCCIKTFGV